VNFRYAFYGFSMLERWRGAPRLQKAYLIGMLTDENYALECAAAVHEPKLYLRYCTFLSLFNHFYWVVGVTVGALVVCLLGKAVDPMTIRRWTNGMEFSMAALFLVIFTDQMKGVFSRGK
jgi:4-azaleucine resistance transporter AzlC